MSPILELRKLFHSNKIDAYIIPNNDEFNNEYLPPSAQRLAYITNFTGSAGTAVLGFSKAAFFTDGRYTLQAAAELDPKVFEIFNIADKKPLEWLTENKLTAGFDPWAFTVREGKVLAEKHRPFANLVDQVWKARPAAPISPAFALKPEQTGKTSLQKRLEICKDLKEDMVLLTTADSTNWLLNIRGSDTPNTPFCLCYVALHKSGDVELFIDKRKLPAQIAASFERVKIRSIDEITTIGKYKKILIDAGRTPYAIYLALQKNGAEIVEGRDPCQLPKAIKNAAEIAGVRKAHEIDGRALTKFLKWLPLQNEMDELKATAQLEEFRRENPEYLGPSFDTICGFAGNGAIVHYRSTEKTNKTFSPNNLVLVDSGGQYAKGDACGTTDVTRTIAIGEPTPEMKHNYTLVLKGHIALATAKFPRGTTGAQLDALARQYLWREGLDYDHGTGHGVGCFLSVHEGPQGISKRYNDASLQPGMILSNEPGYYKEGAYGIRIENLVLVVEDRAVEEKSRQPAASGGAPLEERSDARGAINNFLRFETLTKAPFDDNLIEWEILTPEEKLWIKEYHEKISRNI
jgi:Xaa-Pro aminopeptidase